MRKFLKKLSHGRLEPLVYGAYSVLIFLERHVLSLRWYLQGFRKPDAQAQAFVAENVTFLYKSFERQRLAARLYRNIHSYYPGARVIIADDSAKPLQLTGDNLTVLQLPFNSGLSYGLNRALEQVQTPYVMRMDDDELLTLRTDVHGELKFLMEHPQADLAGFGVVSTPRCLPPEKSAALYYRQSMAGAPKPLKIPHMTLLDPSHIVLGKTANVFLTRTDRLREIGWDDHIRMIDHNEFFTRAAGNLVSVMNPHTVILHCHNQFNRKYQSFRADVEGDRRYISMKYR